MVMPSVQHKHQHIAVYLELEEPFNNVSTKASKTEQSRYLLDNAKDGCRACETLYSPLQARGREPHFLLGNM